MAYHAACRNGSNCDLQVGKRRYLFAKGVRETERIWRRYHLTYDQAVEVGKHVRHQLEFERPAKRRTVVDRFSRDESNRFIAHAHRVGGQRGPARKMDR